MGFGSLRFFLTYAWIITWHKRTEYRTVLRMADSLFRATEAMPTEESLCCLLHEDSVVLVRACLLVVCSTVSYHIQDTAEKSPLFIQSWWFLNLFLDYFAAPWLESKWTTAHWHTRLVFCPCIHVLNRSSLFCAPFLCLRFPPPFSSFFLWKTCKMYWCLLLNVSIHFFLE